MLQPCYLARSFISSDTQIVIDAQGQGCNSNSSSQFEAEEKFYEAQEDLNDIDSPHALGGGSGLLSPTTSFSPGRTIIKAPSFNRIAGLLPTEATENGSNLMEATDTFDSFVKAQVIIFDQNSPLYSNIDTKVSH